MCVRKKVGLGGHCLPVVCRDGISELRSRGVVEDLLRHHLATGVKETQHQREGYQNELDARRARWVQNYAVVGEAMKKSLPTINNGGYDKQLVRGCIAGVESARNMTSILLGWIRPTVDPRLSKELGPEPMARELWP